MIESIGLDLVEVDRIRRSVQRWGDRFVKRVFTEREVRYCLSRGRRYQSLAARFAAKEAVSKAAGLGWGTSWTDVEVINDAQGRPGVILHGKAKKVVGDKEILLSLSHTQSYAAAVAVLKRP